MDTGAPIDLADTLGGRWFECHTDDFPPNSDVPFEAKIATVATLLPQLRVHASPDGPNYGRHPRERTHRGRVVFRTWAVGIVGLTQAEFARNLHASIVDPELDRVGRLRSPGMARSLKDEVAADVRAGQKLLAAEGVLPWAAFGTTGKLPRGWPASSELADAGARWRREAILYPQPPLPTWAAVVERGARDLIEKLPPMTVMAAHFAGLSAAMAAHHKAGGPHPDKQRIGYVRNVVLVEQQHVFSEAVRSAQRELDRQLDATAAARLADSRTGDPTRGLPEPPGG